MFSAGACLLLVIIGDVCSHHTLIGADAGH